jgi:hypothetical protein
MIVQIARPRPKQDPCEWHIGFCWKPVVFWYQGRRYWAWLSRLERRKTHSTPFGAVWEYKLPMWYP